MVYRVYVEKKAELAHEANSLKSDLKELLQIKGLENVRLLNRYDVENIEKDLFDYCIKTVFSEPQLDIATSEIADKGDYIFAVEYLPGQFDARANSAAECIQIISKKDRPTVRTARVYVLNGNLSDEDIAAIKKYVINPVESREATLDTFDTLKVEYEIPTEVATLDGFCNLDRDGLKKFMDEQGLAMDLDDITFCQQYFISEKRDPTITEIKMIDTYWSDHCRHTTFLTTIDNVEFEDELLQKTYEEYIATRKELNRTKPINLMDLATIATRYLKTNGKLPQRNIVQTAAAGYSSYGNQIGLATGQVDELYHDGYVAKRMEIGAVIAAAPAENVRRERPEDGDKVILLGGRTGRDGCGGATGSSKAHKLESLESCGAEVQKGNAPEERKLQRLFRNAEASRLIKRCNDFGAGGVSVAIGELADGLEIDLNAVPKKYDGLDGTELAISESQERMAVVVEAKDVERFCQLAKEENLEATIVATVKENPYLVMNWNGKNIVNISREFLNSNGAEKHINIATAKPQCYKKDTSGNFTDVYKALASDLNVCSKRGLSERFDSTIGAGTVLMPFGGKYQRTPIQAMVNKVSVEKKYTNTCSLMAWGYNPYIAEKSPYHSAYLAVVESVSKLIATGASFDEVYLTFQEYFEKPMADKNRWGKPMSALLGAFKAQKDLGIASIGGKDSMSGTFEKIDVPPTLVSFAVTTDNTKNIISPEFKGAGHKVVILKPEYDENHLPVASSLIELFATVTKLMRDKKVAAAYTPTYGGVAEAVLKMAMGNKIGFAYNKDLTNDDIFGYNYGAFVLELTEDVTVGEVLGNTTEDYAISYGAEKICMCELEELYENKLESIFKCNIKTEAKPIEKYEYKCTDVKKSSVKIAKPKVLIPVFPGTNCEYDSAKAFTKAGADAEIFVINNLSASSFTESVKNFAEKVAQSQIIFVPGGFSGGDEPDGSGKFITAFFRNAEIKEAVTDLLDNRDGLMGGICNGFQALIKLGLVPYGKIIDTDENCPTLTFNTISRHQSKLVRTRVASNKSPWLANANVGDIITVPISHGEGRFIGDEKLIAELGKNGQIITQYVDLEGNPTYDIQYNPNGSYSAIEGITSPDGRVFGKMGHSERIGEDLYKNVEGNYDLGLFKSAVEYFK